MSCQPFFSCLDQLTDNVIKSALIPRQGDSLFEKNKQVPQPDCLRNKLKWNIFPNK